MLACAALDGRRDWLTADQVNALYQLNLPPDRLRAYTQAHTEEISTGELCARACTESATTAWFGARWLPR